MSLSNRRSMEPYLRDDIQFYEHQVQGVDRMSKMRSVLLADDMGLGKSLQTIACWCVDLINGRPQTMIVVCPSSLKANWHEEFQRFTRNVHSEILRGTPKKKREQVLAFKAREGAKVLIVNYEQVAPYLVELNQIGFHFAAFDEAHNLKNPKAARTKACLEGLKSTRSFLITGSPMLNRPDEIYTMLKRIAPNAWGTQREYENRYCVFGGFGGKKVVGAKNPEELNALLQEVMVRRLKKDVLDLPPVQHIQRVVELHPPQRRIYREIQKERQLTFSPDYPPEEYTEIDPTTGDRVPKPGGGATAFMRLKMVIGTTAAVQLDRVDVSAKLDLAVEDARQLMDAGERVIAFTQYRDIQTAYARRLLAEHGALGHNYPVYIINGDTPPEDDGRHSSDPKKKWSRQEIVHGWSDNPRAGIVIATYQTAGVGLNMTAARYGQFLDKLYVPKLNQQAVDRMHRIGASKTQPIQILEYLAHDTIESRIEKMLKEKKAMFDQIVEDEAYQRSIVREIMDREWAA